MNKKLNFEFLFGLFILTFSLIAMFLVLSKVKLFQTSNTFFLESHFFDIGNLSKGSHVKINGVNVGDVNKISLNSETYMGIVESSYDNLIKIPIDSSFKISNNGIIGSSYIEISLGKSSNFYQNKDVTINNIDAISLEEIINNFIFK